MPTLLLNWISLVFMVLKGLQKSPSTYQLHTLACHSWVWLIKVRYSFAVNFYSIGFLVNLMLTSTSLLLRCYHIGNTLFSNILSYSLNSGPALTGTAVSCLPLVSDLQYRALSNCTYLLLLPFSLPVIM